MVDLTLQLHLRVNNFIFARKISYFMQRLQEITIDTLEFITKRYMRQKLIRVHCYFS